MLDKQKVQRDMTDALSVALNDFDRGQMAAVDAPERYRSDFLFRARVRCLVARAMAVIDVNLSEHALRVASEKGVGWEK